MTRRETEPDIFFPGRDRGWGVGVGWISTATQMLSLVRSHSVAGDSHNAL